jgi:hypothetical protein
MRTCQYPLSKTLKGVVSGMISLNGLLESWVLDGFLLSARSLTSSSSKIGCRFCPLIGVGLAAVSGGGATLLLLGAALLPC